MKEFVSFPRRKELVNSMHLHGIYPTIVAAGDDARVTVGVWNAQ